MVNVFISYTHDSDEHKQWVKNLADDLRDLGLSATFDASELKIGDDVEGFVRRAVQAADFILVICTPTYFDKAERGSRGYVQVDDQYIKHTTRELREITAQREPVKQSIAILRTGDTADSVPQHLRGNLQVDLRTANPHYDEELEILCEYLQANGKFAPDTYETLLPYDERLAYEQPPIDALKNYTQFIESGQDSDGRWYMKRYDPIEDKTATLLFQNSRGIRANSKSAQKSLSKRIVGKFSK